MSNVILFWHRRDLRIADNVGLAAACEKSQKVIGIFCLDPDILRRDDIAPVRITYMIGCLQELQQSYAEMGSQLLIVSDTPQKAIANLAIALQAQAVFWNLDVEPYSQKRDHAVAEALQEKGIKVKSFWDQLLHSPTEILSGSKQPYTIYTPFWKTWINQPKSLPVVTRENLEGLTEDEHNIAVKAGAIALPTAKDLGFFWNKELIIKPGERAARQTLEKFCADTIDDYEDNRNFPSINGTSKLSAALKFGVIGIRTVWSATVETMKQCRSDEAQRGIVTWQKEIAWRSFYQHAIYHFPELATGAYRKHFKDFPWDNNTTHFQAWCEGKTGYPIVDAAMRQLNETGWMHNRSRMIVASFLTKDLIINWQWGEKYFMQKLIDGDIAANNGGWQWSASSGMDAQPLRIFNPYTQSQKFDPEGKYIRQWIPELKSVNLESFLTGKLTAYTLKSIGYPSPIVDHNQQQRKFKELYKEQKDNC